PELPGTGVEFDWAKLQQAAARTGSGA
ncbi:MAG: hypothetical protein JWR39_2379, partial [Devosia sp.]|nr:hypothetical protein [Devosia sp.]